MFCREAKNKVLKDFAFRVFNNETPVQADMPSSRSGRKLTVQALWIVSRVFYSYTMSIRSIAVVSSSEAPNFRWIDGSLKSPDLPSKDLCGESIIKERHLYSLTECMNSHSVPYFLSIDPDCVQPPRQPSAQRGRRDVAQYFYIFPPHASMGRGDTLPQNYTELCRNTMRSMMI